MGSGDEMVFVYGTLRRGASRDAEAFFPGAKFLGCGRVRGVLYDLGDYPGLHLNDSAGWVVGEIVGVSKEALAEFDDWEGIDAGLYRRVRVTVERPDDSPLTTWIYEITDACEGRPVISSGDWLAAH